METPMVVRDLVLVGGGHAHVHCVRMAGMRPVPGVRVTLVTRDVETPYSGMLPGQVSGAYCNDESHIDLVRLCAWAHVRLVHAAVTGLQLDKRCVEVEGRPTLRYDVLSLDVGCVPALSEVPGALQHAVGVKPIAGFAQRWRQLLSELEASAERVGGEALRVALVGGGAGGVEVALAVADATARGGRAEVALLTRSKLVPGHAGGTRARLASALALRGVLLRTHSPVAAVTPEGLLLADGSFQRADAVLWCTQGVAPPWLAASGLQVDASGCVRVDQTLQSCSHPGVFAAGDCSHFAASPRPKAGVFAVRAGPLLERNLRCALHAQPLHRWVPQRRHLALISLGNARTAVASWGPFSCGGDNALGALLWRWKDRIDRKWMRMYQVLPAMRAARSRTPPSPALLAAAGGDAAAAVAASAGMRCGGCGSKVGATVLARVLSRLGVAGVGDDAALVRLPPDTSLCIASVDFFRAFMDDPFTVGAVAATHAMGDCWAMGVQPCAALAIAQVPHAPEAQTERELGALMAGALQALREGGCELVGGHSCEGAEVACGFTVFAGGTGSQPLLRKGGLRPGDALVLTKPLGTGVLLAAHARAAAKGRHLASALSCMRQGQGQAARILLSAGAAGTTDVTGFGLLGHAAEMARAGGVRLCLHLSALPLLAGALEAVARGEASSLAPANRAAGRDSLGGGGGGGAEAHPAFQLLFDPQTAGGLLAGVAKEGVEEALKALRAAGYTAAAQVGEVLDAQPGEPLISLRADVRSAVQ